MVAPLGVEGRVRYLTCVIEKELPFPIPNEKCFYTPNSDLMSLYSILFQCISNGS
jgi:hypothetical protein